MKTLEDAIKVKFFATRDEAWAFMRECDNVGISAGFPSLKPGAEGYSVQHEDVPAPGLMSGVLKSDD